MVVAPARVVVLLGAPWTARNGTTVGRILDAM
ncbi:unannotated protein [freshwater metagenome]|uniref:Unannotated protein n=1 Tax=freshwater metagenome TaxID=449393 RepID=A0A6J7PS24_9ZZZZ